MFSSALRCPRCNKKVFAFESLTIDDESFHQTCVVCQTCKKRLDTSSFRRLEGDFYCHRHFFDATKNKKVAPHSPTQASSSAAVPNENADANRRRPKRNSVMKYWLKPDTKTGNGDVRANGTSDTQVKEKPEKEEPKKEEHKKEEPKKEEPTKEALLDQTKNDSEQDREEKEAQNPGTKKIEVADEPEQSPKAEIVLKSKPNPEVEVQTEENGQPGASESSQESQENDEPVKRPAAKKIVIESNVFGDATSSVLNTEVTVPSNAEPAVPNDVEATVPSSTEPTVPSDVVSSSTGPTVRSDVDTVVPNGEPDAESEDKFEAAEKLEIKKQETLVSKETLQFDLTEEQKNVWETTGRRRRRSSLLQLRDERDFLGYDSPTEADGGTPPGSPMGSPVIDIRSSPSISSSRSSVSQSSNSTGKAEEDRAVVCRECLKSFDTKAQLGRHTFSAHVEHPDVSATKKDSSRNGKVDGTQTLNCLTGLGEIDENEIDTRSSSSTPTSRSSLTPTSDVSTKSKPKYRRQKSKHKSRHRKTKSESHGDEFLSYYERRKKFKRRIASDGRRRTSHGEWVHGT